MSVGREPATRVGASSSKVLLSRRFCGLRSRTAAIRICYGLALTDSSRRRDLLLSRGVETRSYGPVVTERSCIGWCFYAWYLRQRMHQELANTEATWILRRKRGEESKRSVPVLLHGPDPNRSDPIYLHCAECKEPQHLTVQCREWPAVKPRSLRPSELFQCNCWIWFEPVENSIAVLADSSARYH